MPVYTFFDTYDFSGKTIDVFVTHGGSGFSGTIDTIKSLEPNATVNKAIDVSGNSVLDSDQEVRDWVAKN